MSKLTAAAVVATAFCAWGVWAAVRPVYLVPPAVAIATLGFTKMLLVLQRR